MAAPSSLIKQIAAGRRRPDMTRKEYFDHRFRVHGAITDAPKDGNSKPYKYIQTQIFDSVFGPRADGPFNANQHWFGRDDTSELYFRDWDHVLSCFGSTYVKENVAPDGPLFADFESSMILMAFEKPLNVETRLASQTQEQSLNEGNATVAMYFISTMDGTKVGNELEQLLSPTLTSALEEHAQDEVRGLIVNIGTISSKFDLNSYFGGANMPQYALVYKIFLKDSESVPVFRRAQSAFVKAMGEHFDQHESYVLFGKEALVMDVARDKRFSLDRQPDFADLRGPSHLKS